MKQVTINELRAHHVANLLFDYVRTGSMLQSQEVSGKEYNYNYPILVTETVDDECHALFSYPAINFCRGPKMRDLDRTAASILGIDIGTEYSIDELAEIFQDKAKEKRFIIGEDYDANACWEIFYGKDWKKLV